MIHDFTRGFWVGSLFAINIFWLTIQLILFPKIDRRIEEREARK